MEIIQKKLSKMETFCYILGDPGSGECLLIDPAFDGEQILKVVSERGWRVRMVVNTHRHPDHTAGNAYILKVTGTQLGIHRLDAPGLRSLSGRMIARAFGGRGSPKPNALFADGDEIPLGGSSLRVVHTPGHTPGGICLFSEGNLFTGDTLFVGAVGRTDLPGGSLKQLQSSIREKLYVFPDETIVWPGHDYGPAPHSTIGNEKRTNPYLTGQ